MSDGGAGAPPPSHPANGGEFLLSLLHRNQNNQQQHYDHLSSQPLLDPRQHQEHQQQPLALDPAVAAVGPTVFGQFPGQQWPFNGGDIPCTLANPPWLHTVSNPNLPPNPLGFSQFQYKQFSANQLHGNQRVFGDDAYNLGLPENSNHTIHELIRQQQHQQPPPPLEQPKILFGSFSNDAVRGPNAVPNGNLSYDSKVSLGKEHEFNLRKLQSVDLNSTHGPNLIQDRNPGFSDHRGGHGGNNRNVKSTAPPGFPSKQGRFSRDSGGVDGNSRRAPLQQNMDRTRDGYGNRNIGLRSEDERLRRTSIQEGRNFELQRQLDHSGPQAGSNLHSVSASDVEKSLPVLRNEVHWERGGVEKNGQGSRMRKEGSHDCEEGEDDIDDFGEELVDSLLLEADGEGKDKKDEKKKRREKESRVDDRGQWLLSQRVRILKRQTACRSDIFRHTTSFLGVFESLIPAEEERAKQKQLLALLETLVNKEWPEARLYLYGSCANSFGFSKSDIDVCLAINDENVDKSQMLLKLADILQSDNLQNVQALTRARVPIVKLMDPVTGISVDICINNVLAVVNTKLLHDYARIDVRLRQLAFIVKHWAKSRKVNETYHGTLSSYAYVLMCIHFLQQRRPAILPCLQEMDPTYSVKVDNIKCAYFDEVDMLQDFGSRNKETIAQLVWGFFNYWAYGHDYANSVVSVRTGSILSKRQKDWTRRVGNDRHLICIEDPFETSHDLGRVVDKFSIRVLREEFERAAEIMQNDPNPCVTLFEPYVPGTQ